jgi:hypothetical protein
MRSILGKAGRGELLRADRCPTVTLGGVPSMDRAAGASRKPIANSQQLIANSFVAVGGQGINMPHP